MYYTINLFIAGQKVHASDITGIVFTDADARAAFAGICAARSPVFAELAADYGNCRGYRVIAHYDQYGLHDGDCN
jgi:predicted secreted protein